MATRADAIYEGGALHPLEPLALDEHKRVKIIIEPTTETVDDLIAHEFMARCRAEVAMMDHVPTIEETLEALKDVPGSFGDEIIRARGDR